MSIKEELLIKAKRDISKLVKVQRTVTRGGKTFLQYFHVLPTQVKSTDVVVGGHKNLLPTSSSLVAPAKGVFDNKYFEKLCDIDRTKALDYLKDCGITWSYNSNAGINWMRAKMAVKNYCSKPPSQVLNNAPFLAGRSTNVVAMEGAIRYARQRAGLDPRDNGRVLNSNIGRGRGGIRGSVAHEEDRAQGLFSTATDWLARKLNHGYDVG